MAEAQVVLGIDPGSRRTGYGLILFEKGQTKYLASGHIASNEKELSLRLLTMFNGLEQVIEHFSPSVMAVESPFVGTNAKSAITLAEARGIALMTGAKHNLSVFEYTPTTIKMFVTGTGRATKEQVQFMTKNILKLPGTPQSDAADALGCALCYAFKDTEYAMIRRLQSKY